MAELSSLVFVETDELGRPTGLIASEDTDTLTSSLLPEVVKDTVEIVKVADVSGNYPAWNTVSGVSALADVSGELLALPADFNILSGDVQDISGNVQDVSGDVQTISGEVGALTALADVSTELLALPNDFSNLEVSVAEISAVVDAIDIDPSSVSAVSALDRIVTDGSDVLSALSGSMPGINGGPNVLIASALSAIANRIRIIDGVSGADGGVNNPIQLLDTARIQSRGAMVFTKVDADGEEIASLKLQGPSVGDPNAIAYLSASVVGLVATDDIRIGPTSASALNGASSLVALYQGNKDSSGNWDGAYNYLNTGASAALTGFIGASGTLALKNKVDTADIELSAITENGIDADAVTSDKIRANAITSEKISAGAVGNSELGPLSVTSGKIDDEAVTADKIKNNSITADKIQASSLTDSLFGASSINADILVPGSITSQELGIGSVISSTIAPSSIDGTKIKDQSITAEKIQPGAVGNSQLASNDVVDGDQIKENTVDASNIVPNTITTDRLAAGSVDTSNIINDAVGPAQLSDTGVTAGTYTNAGIIVDAQGRITSATDGTGGGGGDSRQASAILVGAGDYDEIDVNTTATPGQYLIYNANNTFTYTDSPLIQILGEPLGTYGPGSQGATFDFGASAGTQVKLAASGAQFTTSGLSKTLLEFDDKSRVALGRNSVPLEISAFGQSDVRLEDDGTSGAFVLIKGSKPGDVPNISKVYLQSADLSADSDCQIDFDTDINMGGSTHLVGNTIGANHIACKNDHGSTLTAGTPVYIKSFVGASNKIGIAEASASVASSMPAVGVLSEDLADGIEGYVDAFGVADGIDTQTPGFAVQETLYVAPGGGLTNVRPTATTDLVQNIGIVERVATQGKIIVLGPGRTNDVPNSPIKLLSTKYTGTGNVPTSLTTLSWDSPSLNNGNISYSAGEFTIPESMAGDFLEFNIQLGLDTALTPSRIKLEMELQKDTGSGYTTEAAAADYVVRNDSIDRGSISISGYIDPAAVSSGDKYRVQVIQVAEGNAGQFWPDACKISIKAHHP